MRARWRAMPARVRTVQEYFQILEDTLIGVASSRGCGARAHGWWPPALLPLRYGRHQCPQPASDGTPGCALHRAPVRAVGRARVPAPGRLPSRRRGSISGGRMSAPRWICSIEKHGSLRVAVEVKSGRRVAGADLSGLRSFAQAHPDVPRIRRLARRFPKLYRLGNVDVLPHRSFFTRRPRLLGGQGSPPMKAGDRLGPYEIQALLGVGGMGEVYRGRDARLGRDVALKVISPKRVEDASPRRRFELEARAASALNHPSIVTVYDVGETAGVSWIAMEWVEGRRCARSWAGLAEGPDALSSRARWPTASRPRTPKASCTATSSPRTSWSRRKAAPRSSTSASPA